MPHSSVSGDANSQGTLYRPATFGDSMALAHFILTAGHGLYEFLLDDLFPFISATGFLVAGIASDQMALSYRNCFVASDPTSGEVVGAANAFPASVLKEQVYSLLPRDREEHIRAMVELQDAHSMFLNALAVNEAYRGQGIGKRLLDWALRQAVSSGLERLSLHVWADNHAARRFYLSNGFVERGTAHVEWHPRLRHCGGSILMVRSSSDSSA
jgi:ribosomal protein S18 acetylase RimI-like enzyme